MLDTAAPADPTARTEAPARLSILQRFSAKLARARDERDRRSITGRQVLAMVIPPLALAALVLALPEGAADGDSQHRTMWTTVGSTAVLVALLITAIWCWTTLYPVAFFLTLTAAVGLRLGHDSALAWRVLLAALVGWVALTMDLRIQSAVRSLDLAERRRLRAELRSTEYIRRYQAAMTIFTVFLIVQGVFGRRPPGEVSNVVIDAAGTVLLIDLLAAAGSLYREVRALPAAVSGTESRGG